MRKPFRFQVVNPGHFHAGLIFKESEHRADNEIDVFATPTLNADAFTSLIERFNNRGQEPTKWKLNYRDGDATDVDSTIEPNSRVVVLAGQNHTKLSHIAKLTAQGINVLADKPWLVHGSQIAQLNDAFEGPGAVMDMMTTRHQILTRVCQAIAQRKELFGEFVDDDEPAILLESVHHLCKTVDDQPLIRPDWYYDTSVQGNGLVDIQNHLVDQALWFVLGDSPIDENTELQLDYVRSWPTPVPLSLFQKSTGLVDFPTSLATYIDDDGVLQLDCNSEIDWRINGVKIRTRTEWHAEEPVDGGDTHTLLMRGGGCVVNALQSAQTDFFPWIDLGADDEETRSTLSEALQIACDDWSIDRFPRIGFSELRSGFHMLIPRALDAGHESHFALVREQFLNFLETDGVPVAEMNRTRLRYRLLGEAHKMGVEIAATDG